jgi:hypothetical protein
MSKEEDSQRTGLIMVGEEGELDYQTVHANRAATSAFGKDLALGNP